jgi:ubiquinone/menaquinone biosynthesis C-methylase UbiE
MNIPNKEDVLKKWAPILNNMGVTGSKANWMSEYAEMHSKNESVLSNTTTLNSTSEDFPNLLPIAMKISAQTIGSNIVSVNPIGGGNSGDEIRKIREDIKAENRDRKIESLIEDKEFEEMKIEDHPDYKVSKGPSGQLFYLDFKYGGTESNTIL